MDAEKFDRAITDHAIAILLRYFGSANRVSLERPLIAIERDRDMLRLHWALSPSVSSLVNYVLEHRHEIQSVLESAVRVEDGIVRGRLDALATVKLRRVSGLTTAVVSREQLRSYASGPNQVLGWVLIEARSLASRFSMITLESAGYRASIDRSLQRLEQCRRLQGIAQIAGQIALNRRPGTSAVLEASRSRRRLYRLAVEAYKSLLAIEAGDPDTIASMLRETLLAPLEPWRRFELAVGFSLAENIATAQNERAQINLLIGDSRREIAQIGRFSIYWQWRTDCYRPPESEPSEEVERVILDAYDISSASDRPDLIVVDRSADLVVAIIEVKYLTGEDATDRIRGAVSQIVRYMRGYVAIEESGALLGRSLIAVSQGVAELSRPDPLPLDIPFVVDFEGIKQGLLGPWAERVCYGGSA